MVLVVTSAAFAMEARMRRAVLALEEQNWNAVGRLDIGGKGFCTGALIAPRLVLTAAHCLYDARTQQQIRYSDIEFLAGWRDGEAQAYRKVRRAVVHPRYEYGSSAATGQVRDDLALLELDTPINDPKIRPFDTGARVRSGDPVAVVSYAFDHADVPSVQELCNVLSRQEGLLVTDCAADFGSSGAPILSMSGGGRPQIVSMISAKATVEGSKVSLGTGLAAPLAVLQAEMLVGNGVFLGNHSSRRIEPREAAQQITGAKFVRP